MTRQRGVPAAVTHDLHSGTAGVQDKTNHDLSYTYGGTGPHQATRIGDTSLVYHGNGNTVRECRDPADATCTERPAHLRRLAWIPIELKAQEIMSRTPEFPDAKALDK